jgi:hypothetical protein
LIIERNIHGILISTRVVQIADYRFAACPELAAQGETRATDNRKSNIVCAEPMPGMAMLDDFLAQGKAWKR